MHIKAVNLKRVSNLIKVGNPKNPIFVLSILMHEAQP